MLLVTPCLLFSALALFLWISLLSFYCRHYHLLTRDPDTREGSSLTQEVPPSGSPNEPLIKPGPSFPTLHRRTRVRRLPAALQDDLVYNILVPKMSQRGRKGNGTRDQDVLLVQRVHMAFIQEQLAREEEALQGSGPLSWALVAHMIENLNGLHLDNPQTYEVAMHCSYSTQ